MNLDQRQLYVAENALRIAIEQYAQDAYVADCAKIPRIAEQFRAQKKEALALLDAIVAGL